MPLACTPQHLKFIKGKATKLKGTEGTEMAFCLLRKKGTKEVLLHFDKPGAVAKYKNPALAHRVLMKTSAFRYATADLSFFNDIAKLASIAGVARNDGGNIVFQATVPGRATQKDLALGCRALKIKDFSFVKGFADDDDSTPELDDEMRKSLLSPDFPTPSRLLANPLALFGSFDNLAKTLEALNKSTDGHPILEQRRETLNEIYNQIASWSEDGVEGVSDAMEALSGFGDGDYEDELEELMFFEMEAEQELLKQVKVLREDTLEALRVKTSKESVAYLLSHGKKIATLQEGHYRHISVKQDFGGGDLLVVNSANRFDINLLSEIAVRGRVGEGRFKKSKSGKKIAFTGAVDRNGLKKAVRDTGLPLAVYLVNDFENLQRQLQRQKERVEQEDGAEEIRKRLTAGAIALPSLNQVLDNNDNTELLEQFYAFLSSEYAAENLAFVLSARNRTGVLRPEHAHTTPKGLYDAFVSHSSTFTININSGKRADAVQIGSDMSLGEGRYATINFDAMTQEIVDLMGSPFGRFTKSEQLAIAIYSSPTLHARFTPDL